MKKKLIQFFNSPKHVGIVSLIIALPIAIFGYLGIHQSPSYTFATATAGTISQTSGTASTRDLTLGFVSGGRIASVRVKAGDSVKKDEVLATLDAGTASGSLSQAQGAYASAQANYQKVINGATGTAIDVAKAAVNTAQINLNEAKKQQAVLVENAHRALLNSTLIAQSSIDTNVVAPTITGSYTKTEEGTISISVYTTADGGYFSLTGLTTGTGKVRTNVPEPIGDSGLSVQFPSLGNYDNTTWTITIPNTTASNYLTNYNAYQQAKQTQSQSLASLQALLDQAQANLTQMASAARPEDVAAAQAQVENAKGALLIAQAAYANTVITAPGDGTVTTVLIAPGQITTPGASAIELLASTTDKSVLCMVPKDTVFTKNGQNYVLIKAGNSTKEQVVTLGISDDTNVEILTGLTPGDVVAIH